MEEEVGERGVGKEEEGEELGEGEMMGEGEEGKWEREREVGLHLEVMDSIFFGRISEKKKSKVIFWFLIKKQSKICSNIKLTKIDL